MGTTRIPHIIALAVMGLVLSGCNRNPAQASKDHLLSDLGAFQSAMDWCNKNAQPDAVPGECRKLADVAMKIRQQYAAGLVGEGVAVMAANDSYTIENKGLPASNAAAGLPAPEALPEANHIEKYVGSVAIGPEPGVVTVKWTHGALAGKQLVLAPVVPDASNPMLCWKIDGNTNVPNVVQQLVPGITAECH